MLPRRPESREETPKEGICDKTLPHRNNIHLGLMKCKGFVRRPRDLACYAMFLPQAFGEPDMRVEKSSKPTNGLHVFYAKPNDPFCRNDIAAMHETRSNMNLFDHSRGGRR